MVLTIHPPSKPVRLSQAQLGLKHHPKLPPPHFPAQYLAGAGSPAVFGAARRVLLCPKRKVWARHGAHFRGGHTGLSLLLPSRKAMGLPQRFREQPFPASTSPRKPIPGREPRAGSTLPAASSMSMRRVHLWGGEPLSAPPHAKGRPSQLPHPKAEERTRDLPLPIHLSAMHRENPPSIHSPIYRESLFHSSSSRPVHRGNSLLPYPSLHGGYPVFSAPFPPPNTQWGGTDPQITLPPCTPASYPSRACSADSLTSPWRVAM